MAYLHWNGVVTLCSIAGVSGLGIVLFFRKEEVQWSMCGKAWEGRGRVGGGCTISITSRVKKKVSKLFLQSGVQPHQNRCREKQNKQKTGRKAKQKKQQQRTQKRNILKIDCLLPIPPASEWSFFRIGLKRPIMLGWLHNQFSCHMGLLF